MSKKCHNKHIDLWGETYFCTRNKDHHGDHTHSVLWPYRGVQWYWKTTRWFNYERYCGATFTGDHARCERKPGHKTWHKSWYFKQYITWRIVN